MKNVNIMGVHQFLGEGSQKKKQYLWGGHKKTIYMGNCLKRGAWTICRGLGKKQGGGCF